MDILRLANGHEYQMADGSSSTELKLLMNAAEAAVALAEFTDANLASIEIETNGAVSGEYEGLTLTGITVEGDVTTFHVRQKDAVKIEKAEQAVAEAEARVTAAETAAAEMTTRLATVTASLANLQDIVDTNADDITSIQEAIAEVYELVVGANEGV